MVMPMAVPFGSDAACASRERLQAGNVRSIPDAIEPAATHRKSLFRVNMVKPLIRIRA